MASLGVEPTGHNQTWRGLCRGQVQRPQGPGAYQMQCRGSRNKAERGMESPCLADLEEYFNRRNEWVAS